MTTPQRTRREALFVAGLGVIILVVFLAAVIRPNADASPTEVAPFVRKTPPTAVTAPASDFAGQVAYDGAVAEARAEDAVKEQLRDPESAQFRNVRAVPHVNGMAVCGEVNAKNGFGGYTGYSYFIVVGSIVGIRTEENAAQFRRIWLKSCE